MKKKNEKMSWVDILGAPKYRGEIRVIDESPLRKLDINMPFPKTRIYLRGTSYGAWVELYEHEVEELRRQGNFI